MTVLSPLFIDGRKHCMTPWQGQCYGRLARRSEITLPLGTAGGIRKIYTIIRAAREAVGVLA
jgi:hypothetical protein